MSQLTFEQSFLSDALENQGFSHVQHGINPEMIDSLNQAYADFTDNLPDPEPETLNRMMVDPDDLDNLDFGQDKQKEWHKYRTNHPQFAKPGGYTNRSLQVATLREYERDTYLKGIRTGKKIEDDPKEYFHYQPNGYAKISGMHAEFDWGKIPPEIAKLDLRFTAIHTAARKAMKEILKVLEAGHPDLVRKFTTDKDLLNSPLRLLNYHDGQGSELAEGHYDKSLATIQIAESHHGLRILNPETNNMDHVSSTEDLGIFFPGSLWKKAIPGSAAQPGWHDVININIPNPNRAIYGKKVVRWALIFFANSELLDLPNKDAMHQLGSVAINSLI